MLYRIFEVLSFHLDIIILNNMLIIADIDTTMTGCAMMMSDGSTCTQCAEGLFFDDSGPDCDTSCNDANCASCISSSSGGCVVCKSGYTLSSGTCKGEPYSKDCSINNNDIYDMAHQRFIRLDVQFDPSCHRLIQQTTDS